MATQYELSREFFDWCFENPDLVTPSHIAVYFFAMEHCNRLGWKKKFGFPTTMAMEAVGIKSYNTYKKIMTDLVDWGFLIMVEKSKNQYSSNVIAISKIDKANTKALDKALTKHSTKQSKSTVQSIDSIDKQYNNETKEQENNILELYHSICSGMPKVKAMNKKRREHLSARIHEFGIEAVKEVITNAGVSEFLNGKNDRNWKADFEWLLLPTNFLKVYEGKYNANGFKKALRPGQIINP